MDEVRGETSLSSRVRFLQIHERPAMSGTPRPNDSEGNMNPMDIPLIVSKIIHWIDSLEDLKRCRRVNKLWQRETIGKLRSSVVFLINDETFPVLLKAFKETEEELGELTEAQRLKIISERDPHHLQEFPFTQFRFTKSQAWTYPLNKRDSLSLDRKLIWEKCINPHATYLDIGESQLKGYAKYLIKSYLAGIKWILSHASNVTEFALSPIRSNKIVNGYPGHEADPFLNLSDEEGVEKQEIAEDEDNCDEVEDETCGEECEFRLPKWFRDSFTAQSVTSLVMYNPVNTSGKKIKSLFGSRFCHSAVEIFDMFPNLKYLQLPSGECEGSIMSALTMTNETIPGGINLHSINALALGRRTFSFVKALSTYLESFKESPPALREIAMPIIYDDAVQNQSLPCYVFQKVADTLTKLELEIDCETFYYGILPFQTDLYLERCTFPNLTHFKVQLDYDSFVGRLVTFNFQDLMKMPKLKEFHYGTKKYVAKDWVMRKLDLFHVDENNKKREEFTEQELPNLRRFHFHGNFTKQAINHLASLTTNLKTLELIFDEENFSGVDEAWPDLEALKLLGCSEVLQREISKMQVSNGSLKIINESNHWAPATCNR